MAGGQRGDGAGNRYWTNSNALSSGLSTKAQAPPAQTHGYQPDGSYKLDTNVTDKQAEQTAGRVAREQFERYMEAFAPQEKAILGTQDDTVAQDASRNSQADAVRSREALERMRSRYGTSQTGAQQQAEGSKFQRSTTLGSLASGNMGRHMDQDRRFNLQGNMLNIGNSLQESAQGGLTTSANNAAARDQAHQQARAQHKANQWGILGAI